MGQPRPLFRCFRSFQTNRTIFTTNQCEKMFIQYTVPGCEPTTFFEHESSLITTRPVNMKTYTRLLWLLVCESFFLLGLSQLTGLRGRRLLRDQLLRLFARQTNALLLSRLGCHLVLSNLGRLGGRNGRLGFEGRRGEVLRVLQRQIKLQKDQGIIKHLLQSSSMYKLGKMINP